MTINIIETLPQNEWDKLIISILKPFLRFSQRDPLISKDDLVQEAWIALLSAAEHFDPSLNIKFTTFAYHYIHGKILRYIAQKSKFADYKQDINESPVENSYVDNSAENNDTIHTIFDLVSDQEHASLLVDYYVKDKSYRTIAIERGISHQCVALRIKNLLNILRNRINAENS